MKVERIYSRQGDFMIPIPENYRDCIELIRSDYYRHSGTIASLARMFIFTHKQPAFAILFWLRLASIKGLWYWPAKIIHRHYSHKYGFQIFPSMKVGYGLCLSHGICIIVNPGTIIGNNVNIDQFVNIGASRNGPAVIGNEVFVFPSACVVDDVHIGSGACIGAGGVVVKDVPTDATVVGVPAKIVNYKSARRFLSNPYPFKDKLENIR